MGEHECQRCGSTEWSDVDYSGCSECREPPDDPGLPLTTGEGNTAGWKCEGCGWTNISYRQSVGSVRECDGCGEPKSTALMSRGGALVECERLRERDEERKELLRRAFVRENEHKRRADEAEKLAGRLREQLDAARQALEFYADEGNYRERATRLPPNAPVAWLKWGCPVFDDEGSAARAALGVEGPAG